MRIFNLLWNATPNALRVWLRKSGTYLKMRRWQAFQRDRILQPVVTKLLHDVPIGVVIETGTYIGETTGWFAQQGAKVWSVEVNEKHYATASERLEYYVRCGAVKLHLQNSVDFLRSLDPAQVPARPLFYLDAHWYDYWPLVDEVQTICQRFQSCVIIIHDFEVPGYPHFLAARGGGGVSNDVRRCNLELIKDVLPPDSVRVFFPRYSVAETTSYSPSLPGYVLIFRGLHKEVDRLAPQLLPSKWFFESSLA